MLILLIFLYIVSVLVGLGGYYFIMVFVLFAYVVDIFLLDFRVLRFGILEVIVFICGIVVYFVSGVWIKNYGY